MGATGTAIVDFTPGMAFDLSFSNDFPTGRTYDSCPTVNVTGQAGILSGSDVEAYIMASDSTADNSQEAHALAALLIRPTITVVTAGVGFTIRAMTMGELHGTFKLRWVWN